MSSDSSHPSDPGRIDSETPPDDLHCSICGNPATRRLWTTDGHALNVAQASTPRLCFEPLERHGEPAVLIYFHTETDILAGSGAIVVPDDAPDDVAPLPPWGDEDVRDPREAILTIMWNEEDGGPSTRPTILSRLTALPYSLDEVEHALDDLETHGWLTVDETADGRPTYAARPFTK